VSVIKYLNFKFQFLIQASLSIRDVIMLYMSVLKTLYYVHV